MSTNLDMTRTKLDVGQIKVVTEAVKWNNLNILHHTRIIIIHHLTQQQQQSYEAHASLNRSDIHLCNVIDKHRIWSHSLSLSLLQAVDPSGEGSATRVLLLHSATSPSVCLSVRHALAFWRNSLIYCQNAFSSWQSQNSRFLRLTGNFYLIAKFQQEYPLVKVT